MIKRFYVKPSFYTYKIQTVDVLTVSNGNTDGVGQPVPPITNGGTYN